MSRLGIHPAPGMGEILPGWFAVPQNPVDVGMSGVSYTPGIGEILPGSFVVPQNPLKAFTTGNVKLIGQTGGSGGGSGQLNGVAVSDCGCGCGGHGGCGSGGGMGQLSLSNVGSEFTTFTTDLTAGNFTQALTVDTLFGFPAGITLATAALAAYFLLGPSTGPSRVARAHRAYRTYASNPRRRRRRR